jgi:cytoskeletal protein RodZ
MSSDPTKRDHSKEMTLAGALVAAGLVMAGVSLVQIKAQHAQVAQATQPLQGTPSVSPHNSPAESKPGGERPTTPAPEPARPTPDAQTQGASPALPPAPAEKTAPPINQK